MSKKRTSVSLPAFLFWFQFNLVKHPEEETLYWEGKRGV